MDTSLSTMKRDEVIASTLRLARRSHEVTAELVQHIAVIDKRRLYGPDLPSTFVFCTDKLGLSEDVAFNFIQAARVAQRLPAILDVLRQGRLHLSGVRLLAAHLTAENFDGLIAKASGLSKRKIEELVAAIAPKPALPDSIRKLSSPKCETALLAPQSADSQPALFDAPAVSTTPSQRTSGSESSAGRFQTHPNRSSETAFSPTCASAAPAHTSSPPASTEAGRVELAPARAVAPTRRDVVSPVSAETFRISFDAKRSVWEKLKLAQDLLRHSNRDGDLASIIERALDLLIADVKKKRFGSGAKARAPRKIEPKSEVCEAEARTVPTAIRREVFERDQTCTHVGADGKRCNSTAWLQLDHRSGFARTKKHSAEDMRLLCFAHNQFAADEMYGTEFMNAHREGRACTKGHTSRGDPENTSSPAAGASLGGATADPAGTA